MRTFLRGFGFSLAASLITAGLIGYFVGPAGLLPLLILSIIEITFSFDNAVLNAKVLVRMSPLWQKLFLSVGIIIAIFGMRLVFPIFIVALTAKLSWQRVVDLALHKPEVYADKLALAHPTITAFGGAFLLMLALHFFMDADKVHHWFGTFERTVQRLGRWWLPAPLVLLIIILLALAPGNHHGGSTLGAGIAGIATYLAINGITALIDRGSAGTQQQKHFTGWAALAMFGYLELLDASFSLDGVLGAFAITGNVILIVAGLGIGAFWVRSLTVFMVRRGTLDGYVFLEHGAHYAIAVLAAAMLAGAFVEVPDMLTGAVGLAFIGGSVAASIRRQKA